jgi:hypothetical protein
VLRVCDTTDLLTPAQKSKIFRLGGVIKAELEKSGQGVALIARSGLDLSRFNVRYSHAGYALKDSPDTPWAVRQLYFACDAQQPLIFDQGMAAFLLGTNEPALGYVSVVLLPPEAGTGVERAVLDKRQALQVLGASYSANAYAFSVQHQNCNQWVVEMLAMARGAAIEGESPRAEAQAWLKQQGYEPTVFDVGWRPLMWAGAVIPWLHNEDHPAADLDAKRFRVSMPASIEAFVQARLPGATRLEFCHTDQHIVVHRGWQPIAEGCVPGEEDTVIPLQ